jgi:hypothetical protein
MPLEFTCPHCNGRTLVDDDYLGHTGPCFQCGKSVTVPLRPQTDPRQAALYQRREREVWRSSLLVVAAGAVTGVITLLVVIVFLWPLIGSARALAHSSTCSANLRAIATALRAYHEQHGTYPPPYLVDATGKPMHSWRVLILPQLGEQSLYERYRFDEPWDGPNNFALQTSMPLVFACPADPNATSRVDTSYLAVVGGRTAFPASGGRKSADFRDGESHTLLVAECHESGIPWTAPRDIPFSALSSGVNGNTKVGIQSSHELGAHVVLADGQTRFLGDQAAPEALEALATVNGGEAIDWTSLDSSP